MKYTPGPWYTNGRDIISKHDTSCGQRQVCVATAIEHRRGGTMEDHLNARLIAAALDLLEAARNIYYNMADREELYDDGDGNEYTEVRLIREAIEKATGKEV